MVVYVSKVCNDGVLLTVICVFELGCKSLVGMVLLGLLSH